MTGRITSPDLVPVLSPGKHRNPRKGACFMEMASFLAGEKWSDHPRCTHPLLASLARMVNDSVTDPGRRELAPMIPDVIGLTSDDIRVDAELALECATEALPVAALSRQHVLAVGIITADGLLAEIEERPASSLRATSRAVLDEAPEAEAWARRFATGSAPAPRAFRSTAAPHIVAVSVEGVAQACIDDVDDRLVAMLQSGITLLRSEIGSHVRRAPSVTGGRRARARGALPW